MPDAAIDPYRWGKGLVDHLVLVGPAFSGLIRLLVLVKSDNVGVLTL